MNGSRRNLGSRPRPPKLNREEREILESVEAGEWKSVPYKEGELKRLVVTILTLEDHGTFTLGPDAEAALLPSLEEADRGEVISGQELLRELRRD